MPIELLKAFQESAPSEEIRAGFKVNLSGFVTLRMDQEVLARIEAGSPTIKEQVAKALLSQIESMGEGELLALIDSVELTKVRDGSVDEDLGAQAIAACEAARVQLTVATLSPLRYRWDSDFDDAHPNSQFASMELAAMDAVIKLKLQYPAPAQHLAPRD